MKKYSIYKIVNPDGKVYIGCTINMQQRMKQYRNGGKSNKNQKLLCRSLMKYGFENHSVSIIEEGCASVTELHSREIFWIRSQMSNRTKWPHMSGLNLTDGGEGAPGHIGALKGQQRPKHVCDNISKGKTGIKASLEHRANLSKSHKGLPAGNRKAVIQLDMNGCFIAEHVSIMATAKSIGGSKSGVHRILTGERDSYRNFKFKFK